MSVRVVVTDGVLALPGRELMTHTAPWGMTLGELIETYTPGHWASTPAPIVQGELARDLNTIVPDGGVVLLAPQPGDIGGGGFLGIGDFIGGLFGQSDAVVDAHGNFVEDQSFANLAGNFFHTAITYGAVLYYGGALAGWWGPTTETQKAQDVESPTYGWDGVRTSVGPGHLIPTIWGLTISAGHVIYAEIRVTVASREFIVLVAALSEGRLYAIGDVVGGGNGEVGQMGRCWRLGFPRRVRDLPSGLKINGVDIDPQKDDNLMMELRLGSETQHPLTTAFQGVTSVVSTAGPLNNEGDEATLVITTQELLHRVDFILRWPNGCWEDLGNGTIKGYLQEFEFAYRRPGVSNAWTIQDKRVDLTPLPIRGGTARAHQIFPNAIGGGFPGPIEVRVKRLSKNGGTKVQSQCLLSQVGWSIRVQLAYPRIAHIGIVQEGSELISGRVPQYEFTVRGRMVRTWDDILGFSARVFEATDFATEDPAFDGIWTNPPGRNPAWCALEYLTSADGLGAFLTDASIDLPAFRNWADNCDGDLGDSAPAGTPRYQFDHVMDVPKSSWDQVQLFARAGRARIVIVGNLITVDYDYTAAHGRGTNTVPARIATMLVSDSNVRDLQLNYLPVADRPTVIQFQFLNRTKSYKRDLVSIEDPDNNLNVPWKLGADGYVLQTFDRFEVSEETQLIRDGLMMHGANRKLRYACEFVAASDALPARVGDVFQAQGDVIKPFDVAPLGFRIGRDISSEDVVQLDHAVVLSGGGDTYAVVIALDDGTLQQATITHAPGSYPAFTDLDITAATNLSVSKEAVVVIGILSEEVLDFQIRAISLTGSMDRRVQALQWDPTVHADVYVAPPAEAADEILDSLHGGALSKSTLGGNPTLEAEARIGDLHLDPGEVPGSHTLRWSPTMPVGANSTRVRVYMRATKAPELVTSGWPAGGGAGELPLLENPWTEVGETRGTEFHLESLGTLEVYDFAVAEADPTGVYQTVDAASQLLAVEIPEFPPLAPRAGPPIRAYNKEPGVLLEWDDVADEATAFYEVRQGPSWAHGDRVGCTPCTHFFHRSPRRTTQPYRVRAVSRHGIGSQTYVTLPGTDWLPPGRVLDTENEEYPNLAVTPGTETDLTYNIVTREMEIAAGKYWGTYVSAELDLTVVGSRYWWVNVSARGEDNELVDDWDFPVESGEAKFREVDDREATHAKPGVDLETQVDDLVLLVDALPDSAVAQGLANLTAVYAGTKLEVRFHDGATWGAYTLQPSCTQLVTAERMQVRLTMARQDLKRQLYTSDLRLGASDTTASAEGATTSSVLCLLRNDDGGNINAAASDNLVVWEVQDILDTGFTHSTSTNPSRIEVDADGRYAISVQLAYTQSDAITHQNSHVKIRKNGGTDLLVRGQAGHVPNVDGVTTGGLVIAELVVDLAATDYIEVLVDRDAGTDARPLDTDQSWIKVERK